MAEAAAAVVARHHQRPHFSDLGRKRRQFGTRGQRSGIVADDEAVGVEAQFRERAWQQVPLIEVACDEIENRFGVFRGCRAQG